nr:MAG TPA: hypothetical protein [Caudoviricetes sp.]
MISESKIFDLPKKNKLLVLKHLIALLKKVLIP